MRKNKIRIGFTSIFYPVFMGRYLLEALLRRTDVQVFSAGLYTGRSIPWAGGMYLPEKYLLKPTKTMPMTSPPMVSYPMLEKEAPWPIDLWIEVNAGLTAAGKPDAPLALVLTDPHVLKDFYQAQRARADYVFGMQSPYLLQGDILLPYAYSPQWHRQTRIPFANREHDVALIGLHYPQRTALVERLRQPNNHPHRNGAGFEVYYDIGPAYDDAEAIYHNTRVGFNWSSKLDTTARCFELMAFGIPAVMNRVPDLMRMFKDREDFLGFDTEDEAVAMIHALLNDPEWAEKIGAAGRKAVEPHTWDARVEQILKETGMI